MNRAFASWMIFILVTSCSFANEGFRVNKDAGREQVRLLNENLRQLSSRRGNSSFTAASPLNGIDTLTFAKMASAGIAINATCDDATFLRRVSLLLTGRLPEPADVRSFHASSDPNKRAAYIDQMLDSDTYTTRMTFWFQEFFSSTGFLLRNGHQPFNEYLAEAVTQNKALDVLALELMTSLGLNDEVAETNYLVAGSGNVRLQQDMYDNVAIFTSSKMLGLPLDCISCHDGANHLEDINLYLADKKRSNLWEMAAWYSAINRRVGSRDENNQIVSLNYAKGAQLGYLAETDSGDRPVRDGGRVTPKYMLDGSTPSEGQDWQTAIATKVVNDRQFARNWANRLWGHVFGLAMVEPMDSFDPYRIDPNYTLPEGWESQVLDVALLEHMTDSLISGNFDMKEYLRYMLNSATFQMSSQWFPGNWKDSSAPYYGRYLARHMSSEEVYDSVVSALGITVPIRQGYFGGAPASSANYAHELIDTTQPRRGNTDILLFLNSFGRGNRTDQPRTNQGGITQALMLMNSPVVNNTAVLTRGRIATYLQQGKSEAEIIRELYLDFYAREPDDSEVTAMITELAAFSSDQEKALTAIWLLINRVEFSFIY